MDEQGRLTNRGLIVGDGMMMVRECTRTCLGGKEKQSTVKMRRKTMTPLRTNRRGAFSELKGGGLRLLNE
jgi:hypothetical protein